MVILLGSLQLGILYGMLALGVYITFRIMNVPDLTAEGSFTLGLALSAALTIAGHPLLGLGACLLYTSCVLPCCNADGVKRILVYYKESFAILQSFHNLNFSLHGYNNSIV